MFFPSKLVDFRIFFGYKCVVFQKIGEKIAVAGFYDKAKFTPKRFKWHTREYKIEEITIASDIKDGGVKKRMYSVLCSGNLYRICFNRDDEIWILEEVWLPG